MGLASEPSAITAALAPVPVAGAGFVVVDVLGVDVLGEAEVSVADVSGVEVLEQDDKTLPATSRPTHNVKFFIIFLFSWNTTIVNRTG